MKFIYTYGAGMVGHNIARFSKNIVVNQERLSKQELMKVYYKPVYDNMNLDAAYGGMYFSPSIQTAVGALNGKHPDAVVWAAGLADVDVCQQYPDYSAELNVSDLLNAARIFIERCKTHGATYSVTPGVFVYLSSYSVVGSGTLSNKKPLSVYAKHKLFGEDLLTDLFKSAKNCRLVILRLPNVIGNSPTTSLVRVFDRLERRNLKIATKDGRLPQRCYVDVRDVVSCIDSIIHIDQASAVSTFNICPQRNNKDLLQLVDLYTKTFCLDVKLSYGALQKHHPVISRVPNTFSASKFSSVKETMEFWHAENYGIR